MIINVYLLICPVSVSCKVYGLRECNFSELDKYNDVLNDLCLNRCTKVWCDNRGEKDKTDEEENIQKMENMDVKQSWMEEDK